jgi:hypothetical protein
MFFRNPPINPIDKLKIFLQLSPDFEIKNNYFYSNLLTTEKANTEAMSIYNKLKQINSEDAVRVIQYLSAADKNHNHIYTLEREIERLECEERHLKNIEADWSNQRITIDAMWKELNKITHSIISIDMSKVQKLHTLIFVSSYEAEEKESYVYR